MEALLVQIVDGNGKRWGPAELTQLLHAAGAEPQHCSEAWVANHFRWIVWKLACYERRLPEQLARRMLTVPVILDQLKYRRANAALALRTGAADVRVGNSSGTCYSQRGPDTKPALMLVVESMTIC